jgi:ribose transport system permease protein
MLTSKRISIDLGFDRFSGLYLWALFILVFGVWSPHIFLTISTLHSVGSEQAISGMLALAVLMPLAGGQFDLSVGANANVVGIIAIVVQDDLHWNVAEAVLLGVAAGFAIGAVNGFLIVKLGVSSFIATLGMGSILAAVQVIVTSSEQPPPVTSSAWSELSQFQVGGFQGVVLYFLILAIIVWWLLDQTPVGRYIYAIGGNSDAARLSGVHVDRWTWLTLILSGGVAGFGGILYTSLTGPSLSFGATLLLPAFAAAFLGSTQLQPGRVNVWGTVIAIYVLATGVEGLRLVSGQQWLDDMFNGVALIVAVAVAVNRQRHTAGKGGRRATARDGRSADSVDQESGSPASIFTAE